MRYRYLAGRMRGTAIAMMTTFALLFLSVVAFGQRTTGNIEGTVTDANGGAVPGVSVTVTGVSVGLTQTTQSDSQGAYRFKQVPAGTYKITTAATAGFAAMTINDVTVTIENVVNVNIKLGIASASESVVVTTDSLGTNLETTDSKVQTNITSKLIDQLPKGVSFDSLLRVSPATRSESISGGFQVDGASGAENTFIVDGVPVENFRTGLLNSVNNFPTSLISEVQIKTGGFEAEHGGASGGVVVIATKSGSDQFHGEFGSQFEPSALQPGPRVAPSHYVQSNSSAANVLNNPDYVYLLNQNKDQSENIYPYGTFSGPLVKGRAWFLGSYSPQIYRSTRVSNFIAPISNDNFSSGSFIPTPRLDAAGNPIAPLTYNSNTTNEYAFSRVDVQILNNLRGYVTYMWNPQVTDGTFPFNSITTSNPVNVNYAGQSLPSNEYYGLTGGRVNSNNFNGQLVYTPNAKTVVTFRYGREFLNEKGSTYGIPDDVRYTCSGVNGAYSTINTGCPGGINYQNFTNNSITQRDASVRNEFTGDVTYVPGNFAGKHEFKGGYTYGRIVNDVLSGYSNTGRVALYYGQDYGQAGTGASLPCDLGTPSCLGVGTLVRFGTSGVGHSSYQGAYIQDKWQPTSRLTLNLGVRLENENLPSFNAGEVLAGAPISPIKLGWGKKVAPRLGGAYDPFGTGKTKIYASYGWFYDRLRFDLSRGSFGGDFYRVDYFPITADHPNYDYYTPARILGNFTDPIGGGNPSLVGGLSQLQRDYRIPSNLTAAQAASLGLFATGVDPNIQPFRQSEFTVGFERELARSYVLSVRFTRKNIDQAIEDHAILGVNEAENYPIGNPGSGNDLMLDQQAGYVKSAVPQRLYRALEISLNKRLANNYYFNATYTRSSLYGNYSGLASSDEVTITNGVPNGRVDPAVNRFFDYAINGFTALGNPDNGALATDRPNTFKAYGGYTFNKWRNKAHSTDLSFFWQALQGTPQTTFLSVVATSIPLSERGDLGRTPTLTQMDLAVTHNYKFGRDERYALAFFINVNNIFNQNTVTYLNSTKYRVSNTIAASDVDPNYDPGTQTLTSVLNQILMGQIGPQLNQLQNGGLPSLEGIPNPLNALYGVASSYQAPRNIRLGFRFTF
ncbi:MAG: carboxypeptidase regulatory-like domain-containing protein [Blastocatellia bacterium]|nr:carboxypeptidase regulatory-like domain-containing protein [Blastocatellia bacterium]